MPYLNSPYFENAPIKNLKSNLTYFNSQFKVFFLDSARTETVCVSYYEAEVAVVNYPKVAKIDMFWQFYDITDPAEPPVINEVAVGYFNTKAIL